MSISLPDGQSTEALRAFINELKERADHIAEIQEEMSDICKSARDAGFNSTRMREVVAWLRKVEKHGLIKMEEAEALFDLYRMAHQGQQARSFDEVLQSAQDRALAEKFLGTDQVDQRLNEKRRQMAKAADMARGAREARGG